MMRIVRNITLSVRSKQRQMGSCGFQKALPVDIVEAEALYSQCSKGRKYDGQQESNPGPICQPPEPQLR